MNTLRPMNIQKGNDNYQKNKVIYHLGIVKSYLGYYNDALELLMNVLAILNQKL